MTRYLCSNSDPAGGCSLGLAGTSRMRPGCTALVSAWRKEVGSRRGARREDLRTGSRLGPIPPSSAGHEGRTILPGCCDDWQHLHRKRFALIPCASQNTWFHPTAAAPMTSSYWKKDHSHHASQTRLAGAAAEQTPDDPDELPWQVSIHGQPPLCPLP